ncbi:MAG: DinB family protein [Chloroflexota bacterium]|nr:DinB family protein [Chloroflexota bacterium]
MTDRTLTGLDVIRFLCDFRNGVRPRIVAAIVAAKPEDIYRPGTIPGGNGDGSVFATFVHIVDVEESWLHERLLGEGDKEDPDPERYWDIAAVTAIWETVGHDWERHLADITEEEITAPFVLGRGVTVPTWTIALHVFNHTTHHRAEIWTALTTFGEHPPELEVLDFVDPRPV